MAVDLSWFLDAFLRNVSNIIKIDGKMTGASYVNIIRDNLQISIERIWLENSIFQPDNDPKHTTRIAKTYFDENLIEKLDWPSQTPDLNPIEHLWATLDYRIPTESRVNLQTFLAEIQDDWNALPGDILANLVNSMQRRLQAVIDNKGRNTKY